MEYSLVQRYDDIEKIKGEFLRLIDVKRAVLKKTIATLEKEEKQKKAREEKRREGKRVVNENIIGLME